MKNVIRHISFILLSCALALAVSAQAVSAAGKTAPKSDAAAEPALLGDPEAASKGWDMVGQGALLIDVRSASEYEAGHIEGSLNIPHGQIDAIADAIGPDKDRQVVLYCRSGNRSGKATAKLKERGFTGVFNATGLDALQSTRP